MKPIIPFLRTAAKFLLVFTLPVIAGDTKPEQEASVESKSEIADNQSGSDIAKMDQDEREVEQRVRMSAPMELELENGVDPIAAAVKEGFIIEVSLENVEAAVAAAVLTPDPEDDQRALELMHRGSYRFFVDESPTGEEP